MTAGRRLVILAIASLPAGHAAAQTLPWPADPPPAGAPGPWPGQRGSPPGDVQACVADFARLREEAEKRGKDAKAASQRHAGRKEMCTFITIFSEAEVKWVTFAETNVRSCGIPIEIVSRMKQIHANTEQTRQRICTAGPAAGTGRDDSGRRRSGSFPLGDWRVCRDGVCSW